MFATEQQLQLLCNAKVWYADATFQVVKQPFAQLFSLHAFVKHGDCTKQLPLLFVLMSGRKTQDYKDVLRAVIALLPSEPCVKRVVIDFERAMWKGFVSVMPEVELKGCAFHWSQAVWRKVQEYGLQQQYMKDTGTLMYIKRLIALPFLPAQHIPAVFNNLAQDAGSEPLCRLVEYVRHTWLESTIWPPAAWSVFSLNIRTNNDVEGWHRRLNFRGRQQMCFYMLVQLLHQEARLITIQVRLISEKKLQKHQRKTYIHLQANIFQLWQEYEDGHKSARQLLNGCAKVYGPAV